jgi:integrase
LAVRARKLAFRPYVPSLEVRNTRIGFFERHEFEAVRSQLPDEIKPVVTMAYLTGWRVRSEILTIQWRQVDLRAGIVRLEPGTTKNDEGRTFPLSALSELSSLFEAQWEYTQAVQKNVEQLIPWVFHRNGKPIKDFTKAWSTATDAPGVPDRIVHDFRRTAVRNLERAGVPRSVAMKLVGHKTEAIYRRYAVTSESDLIEGVRKLSALHVEEGAYMSGQNVSILKRRKAHGKQALTGE